VHGSTSVAGGRTPGATPGQGIEHRSDRANEVAQNVYKNKHLQGEFSDPDSPYYQGDGTGTDENGQPIGNCNEINAGCTAGQEEIEDYIGDEIIVIGSSSESLYYYHPDHLGSASVITDGSGNLREHIEYFAFGETWVQEGASKKTPNMYTGKELDQETGLYYYGARYYDPRTSVWQSVDPILEKYMPSGDPEKDKNLPGMGGVFNSANLAGYTQSHNNPVKYSDPDGNAAQYVVAVELGVEAGAIAGTAVLPGVGTIVGGVLGGLTAGTIAYAGTDYLIGILFNESGEDTSDSDTDNNQPKDPPDIKDFEDPKDLPEGWMWKGKGEPGSREGAYNNPDTGESLHDDRSHPPGKDPHVTYTDKDGVRWDNYGDGWNEQ